MDGNSGRLRMALVVGNDNYNVTSLKQRCAVSDARMVAEALAASGFEVWFARDRGYAQTLDLLRRFAKASDGADTVHYFGGYGGQVEGEDVLLPIDVAIDEGEDAHPKGGIRLADVQSAFLESGDRSSLSLWLDISRASLDRRDVVAVPREVAVPLGQFILFATQRGSPAFDCVTGTKGGAFAEAVVRAMQVPGATMAQVARQVRQGVAEHTQGRSGQLPEFIDHSLRDLILGLPRGLVRGRVVDVE